MNAREGAGNDVKMSDEVLACRTGKDFSIQMPDAKNLVELTSSKVNLGCAIEFSNYILFSMEG